MFVHKENIFAPGASPTDGWQQLVLEAQEGDKVSYKTLLERVQEETHRILMDKVTDKNQVIGITQEVLIGTHKALHTYSPECDFKPWLHSIINYKIEHYEENG